MVADNIKKVKDAEGKAHQLLVEARSEAEKIIRKAHEDAVLRKKDAGLRAGDQAGELRAGLISEAEAEVESIEREAADNRERIREAGNARIDDAVRAVLKAF
ncbi:MAG: hypothetical protein JXA49_10095 [Actinobacteria bacterium]|nr:hypothetical protein [Actinomycetota bacterium]